MHEIFTYLLLRVSQAPVVFALVRQKAGILGNDSIASDNGNPWTTFSLRDIFNGIIDGGSSEIIFAVRDCPASLDTNAPGWLFRNALALIAASREKLFLNAGKTDLIGNEISVVCVRGRVNAATSTDLCGKYRSNSFRPPIMNNRG
jgi:hypothetical protein